jgi:addiction module HigA family antidote
LGQIQAAERLGISLNRLNEIVLGKRGITADTALRLSRLLKTSPQLWMRLQADWEPFGVSGRRRSRCTCFVPDTQVLSASGVLSA